jgi:hypothetical protein
MLDGHPGGGAPNALDLKALRTWCVVMDKDGAGSDHRVLLSNCSGTLTRCKMICCTSNATVVWRRRGERRYGARNGARPYLVI